MQDIESYEEMQESIALLKILAQSTESKLEGKYKPLNEAFESIRTRMQAMDEI